MIEDIRRFIAIADNRSITKAAQHMHMTQPAVSLSLQRLEKAMNTTLFLRTGKQFSITSDGQAMYRICLRILALWDRAKNASTRISASQAIVIGLFDNAALKLAPFFKKQLLRKDCTFEIKIDTSANLLQDLFHGISDICICVIEQEIALPKNTILLKTLSEELIPVSQKNLGNDISKIPFIVYNKGSVTRKYINKTFLENAISPTIIAESTSTSFMKELALAGSGVALLPKNVVKNELKAKELRIQKLPFKFFRTIGILLRKDSPLKSSPQLIEKISSYLS